MLRSVGMDQSQIRKMLMLEGIRMAISPALSGMTVILGVCAVLLRIADVAFIEFWPWFPLKEVLFITILMIGAVYAAYPVSARRIRNDTIIDGLREENVSYRRKRQT